MNRFLALALFMSTLLVSEGCRRQRLTRSSGSPSDVAVRNDSGQTEPQQAKPLVDSSLATRPEPVAARPNVASVDFRYLTTKSKLSFKSPQEEIDNASLTIRMRKDSLIWMSISKLGLEAARILITPDSIVISDKIHRQYAVSDFPSLSRQFNFRMSFELLQAMLVGNLPLPDQPAQAISNGNDYQLLRQTDGNVVVENYIGEPDRKLKKLLLTEQSAQQSLQIDYDTFTLLNTFLFPFNSVVRVDYRSKKDGQPQQTTLRITHSRVELIEASPGFPFSIPASYQRRP